MAGGTRHEILANKSLPNISNAIGASRTTMLSINKTWAHKRGDFFVDSTINFLAA